MQTRATLLLGFVLGVGATAGGLVAFKYLSRPASPAEAAGGQVPSPTGTAQDRYVYMPGTEELGKDEMRVIACGTGMPAARHGQAATCFLVELGNGDKFLFDLGTGSMANVAGLMIPYDYLDKIFLSHLHTDHWGDLAPLWAGGWSAGRTEALKVWGPSGARPDMGTKYAVEHLLKAYNWDYMTRSAVLNNIPGRIEVTEFDYKGENQVVYSDNGVEVRSWPAIHSGDGAVSYALMWNGYKFVFGGDTYPNKWFVEHAKDADLVIHECMMLPEGGVEFYNQNPQTAWFVFTKIHTSPPAFGKVMSAVRPKHAVAYHFFNEEGTRYGVNEGIRQTYDGPLSLATDGMVWNVTRDGIKERMAQIVHEAWPVRGTRVMGQNEPDDVPTREYTRGILEGNWDVSDAEAQMQKDFMKKYNMKPPKPPK